MSDQVILSTLRIQKGKNVLKIFIDIMKFSIKMIAHQLWTRKKNHKKFREDGIKNSINCHSRRKLGSFHVKQQPLIRADAWIFRFASCLKIYFPSDFPFNSTRSVFYAFFKWTSFLSIGQLSSLSLCIFHINFIELLTFFSALPIFPSAWILISVWVLFCWFEHQTVHK